MQPPDAGVGRGVGGGLDSLIVLSSELRVQDEDRERSKRRKERRAEREARRAAKRAAKNKERVEAEDQYRRNAKKEANAETMTKLQIVKNEKGSPLNDVDNLWGRPQVGGKHYVQFEKVKMWLDLSDAKYEFRLQKHVPRSHWQALCRYRYR